MFPRLSYHLKNFSFWPNEFYSLVVGLSKSRTCLKLMPISPDGNFKLHNDAIRIVHRQRDYVYLLKCWFSIAVHPLAAEGP